MTTDFGLINYMLSNIRYKTFISLMRTLYLITVALFLGYSSSLGQRPIVGSLSPENQKLVSYSASEKVKPETLSKYGQPVEFKNSKTGKKKLLWGITTKGGKHNQGTVFSFDLQSKSFNNFYDYSHPEYFIALSGNLVQTPDGFAALSVADGTGGGEIITLSHNGKSKVIEEYGPHNGSITLGSDNHLYVVDDWIEYFRGGISRIHVEGDNVNPLDRIIFRFDAPEHGLNPTAQLLEQPDGFFYGVAPYEGDYGFGTLFKLKKDGSDFAVVHHFQQESGANPSSSVIAGTDGFLYGVTEMGGAYNNGVIYRVKTDGSNYTALHHFNGSNGKFPKAALLLHNNLLFGTASTGGNSDQGVIFSVSADGNSFSVLHHFSGANGSLPLGALTANEKGELFGMSSSGGSENLGVIFTLIPGQPYNVLHHFTAATGGAPNGALLLTDKKEKLSRSNTSTINDFRQSFSVGPNPFNKSATATFSASKDGVVEYWITDMNGIVVQQFQGRANTPVTFGEDLSTGIYMLKIKHGTYMHTEKLIKR